MNTPTPIAELGQYFGSTPPTDLSMQLWSSILGDFATNPFSSLQPTTLMGSLFIVFNAAIFAIGTVWLTYGVLSAMAGTAQDGQALGRRMNPLWYPIRAITGISGMTPILGGFTLSQGLLMWVATLGIGVANMIANTAINNASLPLFQTTTTSNPTSVVNAQKIARAMLESNLCTVALNFREASGQETGVSIGRDVEGVQRRATNNAGSPAYFYSNRLGEPVCGSVTVKTTASPRKDWSAFGFRVASVDYTAIAPAAAVAQYNALGALDERMRGVAQEWWRGHGMQTNGEPAPGPLDAPGGLAQALDLAARQYINDVGNGFKSTLGEKSGAVTAQALNNMKVDGWMGIGGWFSTFSEVNAAIADATNAVSIYVGTATADFAEQQEVMGAKLAKDRDLLGRSKQAPASGDAMAATMQEACASGLLSSTVPIATLGMATADEALGTATGNCSLGQALVQKVIETSSNVGGSTGPALKDHLVNPIIAIKNLGDYILSLSSTIFFSDWLVDVAEEFFPAGRVSKTLSGVTDKVASSNAAQKGAELMTTLGMLLFAAGAYMALYVPLIPFVVWVGGLVAYSASFIEGLFAMPLHSLSHLDTEGEGMGQRTAHGYLFFLNTLARPALMVLSFFLASSLAIGLGTIVTKMYLPALANAQGNSVTGLVSVLGYTIIYGLIMSIILNACFELVQVIPDQVIGFVGAGSVSTKLGSDAEGKINNLFMMAARVGPQMKTGPKGLPKSGPKKEGGG